MNFNEITDKLSEVLNESVNEEVETVGDKVANLSRQAIELINQIMDYTEESMPEDDVKTLEDALYILQEMVPELQ